MQKLLTPATMVWLMSVCVAHAGGVDDIRITEIMYCEAGGGSVDYIELKNMGTAQVNLAGIRFDDGKPFAAFAFPTLLLSPAQTAVLTNDRVGLSWYHLTDYLPPPFVPNSVQWSSGDLGDTGDEILMRAPDGSILCNFTYSNAAPWPTGADGTGKALKIINPNGDYSDPANWFAEMGNPGNFFDPFDDTDGDEIADAQEMLFGTNPQDANSRPYFNFTLNAERLPVFTWPVGPGRRYAIQYCDGPALYSWANYAVTPYVTSAGIYTFTDTNPSSPQRFYRLMAY